MKLQFNLDRFQFVECQNLNLNYFSTVALTVFLTFTAEGKIIFLNHAANLSRVEVERLFERFFTVQTAKESTGIGLSIAKVLTEKMSGNIDAAYSAGYLSIQVIFPEK